MLESSYGMTFFLKTPRKPNDIRMIYVRITVDGNPKETSINEKWDIKRWNQKIERATGSKEDAKILNSYLDLLTSKIVQRKTELLGEGRAITAEKLIACINGVESKRNKVLEEFEEHNIEIKAMAEVGELSKSTAIRYTTALGHVREYIVHQYKVDDVDFIDLDYKFIKDYYLYLRTVRLCNNNSALKYITNFKKVIFRAIDKEYIKLDPFRRFKQKRTRSNKKPITTEQLCILENRVFSSERLSIIRDIFVFQCYTGLAYIDVFQLKRTDIQRGIDGEWWILISRQKTKKPIRIPLLPKAIEIMKKYENDPLCIKRDSVLPVRSNQKSNEYLKEISNLCVFTIELNTHMARRTFATTVALKNGVPINIVQAMLGHSSVTQTEEYALTEETSIADAMKDLKQKLEVKQQVEENAYEMLERLKNDLADMDDKFKNPSVSKAITMEEIKAIETQMSILKNRLLEKTG
ncbi:site-specific integrase [Flavobacterium cerinum]|uniref:Site-specific integrase n=1 Tax=Flavobacterium cerinum TaxID=2502784 RepID=A0ABY5IPT5_9FLAO|nr:site-specific integrase [Flavobacterium cerinum]UUC44212.1 site-specific integrase [Flavobacterium cerinum]